MEATLADLTDGSGRIGTKARLVELERRTLRRAAQYGAPADAQRLRQAFLRLRPLVAPALRDEVARFVARELVPALRAAAAAAKAATPEPDATWDDHWTGYGQGAHP